MNPYALIAGAILLAAAFGAGWRVNEWRNDSQDLAVEKAVAKAGEAATVAAVDAIKGLRPQFTTIKQDTIRETHVEPRYLAVDCSHTDAVWLQIRSAYQAAGGSLSGGAGVSVAPVPGGSNNGVVNERAD